MGDLFLKTALFKLHQGVWPGFDHNPVSGTFLTVEKKKEKVWNIIHVGILGKNIINVRNYNLYWNSNYFCG